MRLAEERPEWLDVVRVCYELSGDVEEFAGSWVYSRLGSWFPSLRTLVVCGILEHTHSTRQKQRGYYRMRDSIGVGRALRELGLL
jgi:hypothetical protein